MQSEIHPQLDFSQNYFLNLDDRNNKQKYKYESVEQIYQFFEVVGQGAFSFVYRAKFIPTGQIIAVKISKSDKPTELMNDLAQQEAKLLFQLDHPNIVKVQHLIQINSKLYMGMELIKYGSIQQLIPGKKVRDQSKLSDIDAATIMKSITEAVAYIHDKGVIHRDLKLANILLDDENDYTSVKIIDFGLGERQLMLRANNEEQAGTLLYMAPEVAAKQEYTKSVDVWAIGIIMHQLLSHGKHPFYKGEVDNAESFQKKLLSLKLVEPDDQISWLAKNLFGRLTQIQAHKRYSARDAIKHPWITRNKNDQIPQSFVDQIAELEHINNLKHKIQTCLLMSIMKEKHEGINFNCKNFQSYKKKIKKVAAKIETWHDHTLSQGVDSQFGNDNEFVINYQQGSPSYFTDSESSSSGEETSLESNKEDQQSQIDKHSFNKNRNSRHIRISKLDPQQTTVKKGKFQSNFELVSPDQFNDPNKSIATHKFTKQLAVANTSLGIRKKANLMINGQVSSSGSQKDTSKNSTESPLTLQNDLLTVPASRYQRNPNLKASSNFRRSSLQSKNDKREKKSGSGGDSNKDQPSNQDTINILSSKKKQNSSGGAGSGVSSLKGSGGNSLKHDSS